MTKTAFANGLRVACRRWTPAFIALAVAFAPDTGSAQTGEAITLDDYRARLDAAVEVLSPPPPSGIDRDTWEGVRQTLDVDGVRLTSGEVVAVRPLLPGHDAEGVIAARDVTSAITRLELVAHQLDASTDDDTAHRLAVLSSILARPDFVRPVSLREWLTEQVTDYFARLASLVFNGGSGSGTANALAVVAAAAVGGLFYLWLRRFLAGMVDEAARSQPDAGRSTSSAAAAIEARKLAAGGDYRSAVRELYLAAMLRLDELGVLTFHRDLTNREHLARAAVRPQLAARLRPIVDTFDSVWYGIHEPDQASYAAFQSDVERLMAAAVDPKIVQRPGEAETTA